MCGGGGGGQAPTMQQRSDESLQKIAAGQGWMGVPGFQMPGSNRGKGGVLLTQPTQQNLSAAARPMPFGSTKAAAPEPPSAVDQAKAEIKRRTDLRAQIADQEKAMQATKDQIQQNLVDAKASQIKQEAAQRKQVADLQAQQVQRTGEIAATGQAVSSSLRILANAGSKQGPTAAMAPRAKGKANAAPVRSAGLRMGSTMTGSGVGTNLGT